MTATWRLTSLSCITLGLIAAASGTCSAGFTSVSDFDSLSLGDVNGQGGWTTTLGLTTGYNVAVDPDDAGNQALLATGTSAADGEPNEGNAYISLGGSTIADGTTGTVFFRMRTSNLSDIAFGTSDEAAPSAWGSYEGYMLMGTVSGANAFRVRDGSASGDGVTGAFSGNLLSYNGDEWYNVWLVLDHATDMTSLYASQGSDPAALLGTGRFRTGGDSATTDIVSLNLRMGRPHDNNSAQGYLDDIYVDTGGANLTNPAAIPEPTGVCLASLAAGLAAGIRRRK